jgi:hypothetical protein
MISYIACKEIQKDAPLVSSQIAANHQIQSVVYPSWSTCTDPKLACSGSVLVDRMPSKYLH